VATSNAEGPRAPRVETVFVVGERSERTVGRPVRQVRSGRARHADDGQAMPLGAGPEESPTERRSSRSGESPRAAYRLDATEGGVRRAAANAPAFEAVSVPRAAPARSSPAGPRHGPLTDHVAALARGSGGDAGRRNRLQGGQGVRARGGPACGPSRAAVLHVVRRAGGAITLH